MTVSWLFCICDIDNMTIELFIIALALAFIIEGIVPALFPNKWRAYVAKMAQEPTTTIRNTGVMIMAIGAILLWLVS